MPLAEIDNGKFIKHGAATFTVAAGKTLKVETTPGGQEIILEQVPQGKVWTVELNIRVKEEDA